MSRSSGIERQKTANDKSEARTPAPGIYVWLNGYICMCVHLATGMLQNRQIALIDSSWLTSNMYGREQPHV
jgi:hypothetical protein